MQPCKHDRRVLRRRRNVISGNGDDGVEIYAGASANVVAGDYIGTDTTGTRALGNGNEGVNIYNGASGNTIGGTIAAVRDVISANKQSGVSFSASGTTTNLVAGDYIGTDVTGTVALGNVFEGVTFVDGASGNTIGRNDLGSSKRHLGKRGRRRLDPIKWD